MRLLWPAVAASIWAVAAFGQNAPIQSTQLPPLQQQAQQPGSPPIPQAPIPQVPVSPNPPGPAPSVPDAQSQPPAAPTTVERPNVWVPASVVTLEALDKVNAQATELTIKVGQSATFGSLTITAKACVVRPPDQPADAAAYLTVTDSHPDSPGFDGWMLRNEPSVSMMQHPIYDIRVGGCT